MKNTRTVGNMQILGTAFLWSFLGVITKLVPYSAMTVIGVTSLMALIVLLISRGTLHFSMNKLTILTGVLTAIMNISFLMANKYTTVANAIVLQYCSPIFVVIFYRIFQKRKLKKPQIAAVTICFLGLLVFFADQLGGGGMIGNLLALLSGITFAAEFYLCALPENDPPTAHIISHAICVIVGLGCTALFTNQTYHFSQTAILVLGGLLCSGISSFLYTKGIQKTTALNANLIAMSEVIMAPLWSFLIFREIFSGQAAIGAGLMVLSILYETWFEAHNSF